MKVFDFDLNKVLELRHQEATGYFCLQDLEKLSDVEQQIFQILHCLQEDDYQQLIFWADELKIEAQETAAIMRNYEREQENNLGYNDL